jgi:hypothetical protein
MQVTRDRSQQKILSYLNALGYEQQRDIVLVPSIGWLRRRTRQDHYTVANGLLWMQAIGKIGVTYTEGRSFYVDLAPNSPVEGDS